MVNDIQEQERRIFQHVENDISKKIEDTNKTIARLDVDRSNIYDYEDQIAWKHNVERLQKKEEKLAEFQETKKEPYFIHLQYRITDPKTGRTESKSIYIGKFDNVIKLSR